VALRRRGGGSRSVTIQVSIPAGLPPGERTLVVEGNGFPAEGEEGELLLELFGALTGGGGSTTAHAAAAEPRSPKSLARAVAALHRPLGIAAHFRHRAPRVVLRSNDVRFDGRAKISLRVVRAHR
jgi:hypothetical protein